MSKYTSEELDAKVLRYVRIKRNTNTYKVSQHFGIKWETAERSLKRLQEKCKVFYEPEVKIWSIYKEIKVDRDPTGSQQVEKREISQKTTDTTFEISLCGVTPVRGREGEALEKVGFVCHHKTKGSDVSDKFVRMHLNGQYTVKILKTGSMPESYANSDTGITVGWYEKRMNNNYGYFGRVGFPDDPKVFNLQSLGTKDKKLTTLGVYIHPRYIYYKECKLVASIEFRMQVMSVLAVLETFGWKFGDIEQKGTLHYGLNNRVLPSLVPINHLEKADDPIHFDTSVMSSKDGFCTEAEVFDDHADAENEVDFWVSLPKRFTVLETKVYTLSKATDKILTNIDTMAKLMIQNEEQTERIALAVQDLAEQTNLNTTIILGTSPAPSEPVGYIAHVKKEDVMYGRDRRADHERDGL